jgi:hypothetical protein
MAKWLFIIKQRRGRSGSWIELESENGDGKTGGPVKTLALKKTIAQGREGCNV